MLLALAALRFAAVLVVFHQAGFTTFLSAPRYTFSKPDETGCNTVAPAPVWMSAVRKK
jgi:hypothetical protein